MIYSTSSNTLTTQNANFPGVVLAVSPNNSTVLINDQINRVFKLYNVSTSALTASFDGLGSAAAWTPDAKTLYITDSAALGGSHADRLYVYNANTDVTTYDLSTTTGGSKSLAITIPSVGAYLSGSAGYDTVAHTWCPAGNVGDYSGDANSILFYPQGPDNAVIAQTDALAATTDGQHILGAAFTGSEVTLTDIGITIPTTELTTGIFTPIACPETTSSGVETLSALSTNPWINATPATPTLDPNLGQPGGGLAGVEPGLYHLYQQQRHNQRPVALLRAQQQRQPQQPAGGHGRLYRADRLGSYRTRGRRLQPGRSVLLRLHLGRQHDPLHQRADLDRHPADEPRPACLFVQ
jgi:hypothetical protein